MKRNVVFVALLVSLACSMQAQDTIRQRFAPLGNYFSNHWIDTSNRYSEFNGSGGPYTFAIARQFVTEDTMEVYGIAAMMVHMYFGHSVWYSDSIVQVYLNNMFPEDPTFNNCEESLLLFQYQGNGGTPVMQQLGDSLHVHYTGTPPTHYMMSSRLPLASIWDTIPHPIYERYFTTPQTVHDTFYAGFTKSNSKYDKERGVRYDYRPTFSCMAFDHHCEGVLYLTYEDEAAYLRQNYPDSTIDWNFQHYSNGVAYYIFPILTPQDTAATGGDTLVMGGDTLVMGGDTLVVGGDTLVNGDTIVVVDTVVLSDTVVFSDTLVVNCDTILVYDTVVNYDTIVTYDTIVDNLSATEHGMLGRMTGVTPNPAAATARVVSSFGLTRVEAFNLRGERVATLRLPETSLAATLDVSRWPVGIYLLRIHTPQGSVIKRLTVTR